MSKILTPNPSKTHEREFSKILEAMVLSMGEYFKNQVLKQLNKSTVEKFSDAQTGNYAVILQGLFKKFRGKMNKRFSEERIKNMVNSNLNKVNKANQNIFYKNLGENMGLDSKQLIANEGLKPSLNGLMLETRNWVNDIKDTLLGDMLTETTMLMSQGKSIDEIIKATTNKNKKTANHAKFVAINQISNFNSIATKLRAEKVGITKAIWRTSKDEAVRPSHKDRDGKEFDIKEGLYSSKDKLSIIPGIDYRCRCRAEFILPENYI